MNLWFVTLLSADPQGWFGEDDRLHRSPDVDRVETHRVPSAVPEGRGNQEGNTTDLMRAQHYSVLNNVLQTVLGCSGTLCSVRNLG